MDMQQNTVPFTRLMRDDGVNVRKIDKTDIESMKASILAHGIIQPIAVRPPAAEDVDLGGQLYRIFAGGRRFRAMQELVAEKKIPADYSVPIIVMQDAGDDLAREMSLAENLIRKPMSPVQEFVAFKELADGGLSVADIALRFGQTERFVKGRLALASLHPDILEAFNKEEISFEAATAYTLNPDIEAQIACFQTGDQWRRNNQGFIRNAMIGEGIRAESEIAKFIGADRYLEAGGVVVEDLFGKDTMWMSGAVISRLKAARLNEARADALSEGWSFYESVEEFGVQSYNINVLHPEGSNLSEGETARMDELAAYLDVIDDPDDLSEEEFAEYESRLKEYEDFQAKGRTFTAEQRAKAGIVYDPDRMKFWIGAVRPGTKASDSSSGAAEKPAKDPLALTQPLKDQIGLTATAALRAKVTENPHLALALMAAMLEQSVNTTMGIGRPSRVKVERLEYTSDEDVKKREIKSAFQHYAKMEKEALDAAIAKLVADTVDLTERWFQKDFTGDARRETTRHDFMTAFEAKPVEHFDPAPFFAASTKPMIDAAMKEMTGLASSKPKKSDMATEAAEAARKSGWLPAPLRLKGYKVKKVNVA